MRLSRLSLSAVAAVFSVSVSALGQEKVRTECTHVPSESDVAAAKGAFEAGQVSFQEADYARAILYWEDAFRRDCTAIALLLNLARAYELSGQKHEAVSSLEAYLARRPNAADRDQITRRIEVLQRQMEEERSKGEESAQVPTSSAQGADSPVAPSTVHDTGASPQHTIWPLFVAGAGLAVGTVGAVLWATNQSTINQCDRIASGDYLCPNDSIRQDAEAAQGPRNAGIGLAVGGAALLAGGTITYFVMRSRAASQTAIAPSIGPGFAGLSLAGQF